MSLNQSQPSYQAVDMDDTRALGGSPPRNSVRVGGVLQQHVQSLVTELSASLPTTPRGAPNSVGVGGVLHRLSSFQNLSDTSFAVETSLGSVDDVEVVAPIAAESVPSGVGTGLAAVFAKLPGLLIGTILNLMLSVPFALVIHDTRTRCCETSTQGAYFTSPVSTRIHSLS